MRLWRRLNGHRKRQRRNSQAFTSGLLARMWRTGGVHRKRWHGRRDPDKNLGSPGVCLFRWEENRRSVPSPGELLRWGGGCSWSTRRWRKTTTWERAAREDGARPGNFCRTRRIGEQEPTSLRGIARQETVSLVTEASPTEEPREGKLHAGICAGGTGRPVSLPRRAP
jgi:hypothetical protein